MKSLLSFVVVIASLAGCTVASDEPRSVAKSTQTNAGPLFRGRAQVTK